MTAFEAFRAGVRRVNGAPAILLGAVALTFLVALPLSTMLRGAIEEHLGPSAAAAAALERADYEWWQEFAAQASGLGATFTPSIIGFAAVLENAAAVLDNQPLPAAIAGVTAAWLIMWSFVSGGIIDRYARARPTRAAGFFAACGTHFWRFARLGVIAGLAYVALFGAVHGWIFEDGYVRITRDVTVERSAFLVRLAGYALFAGLTAACALLFDYARVRIVVEDRRSALGALAAAARLAVGQARRVAALFLLNAAALLLLMAVYAVVAPAAPRSGMHLAAALVLGQAYIVGRHYLKLVVYASETVLFQGSLAHAGYTAAPALVWPESPAVESIINAEATPIR